VFYTSSPPCPSWYHHPNITSQAAQITKPITKVSPVSCCFFPLRSQCHLQHHVLEPSLSKFKVLFILREMKFPTPTKSRQKGTRHIPNQTSKTLHELDPSFFPQIFEPFQTSQDLLATIYPCLWTSLHFVEETWMYNCFFQRFISRPSSIMVNNTDLCLSLQYLYCRPVL
jgi:hypothetical protein